MPSIAPLDSTVSRRRFLQTLTAATAATWLGARSAWSFEELKLQELRDGKRLLLHTLEPRNAEPPLPELIESWITPIERFYVRSHGTTPDIEADDYRLTVEGLVEQPLSLSLAELRKGFEQSSTTATMTCAGNRRNEHSAVKKVSGVQWQAGAIGNANWSGVRLSDLLKKAKVREAAKHVWFEGLDEIDHAGSTIAFGGSIPIEKAMADTPEAPGCLVAHAMNDKPLTADHGFPVRTVVPGYIGARSVKWLGKIVVSDRPSPNHFVADVYKLVPNETAEAAKTADPIYEFPINSAICLPQPGAKLAAGNVTVRGYALPSGLAGRTVSRVEVSADGGATWKPARVKTPSRPFCWRLWDADVEVAEEVSSIAVRAIDSAGTIQPKSVEWNAKGYLFNAWHQVPVRVG